MRLTELKSGINTLGRSGIGDIEVARLARRARSMYPNLSHDDLEAVLKYLELGLEKDQADIDNVEHSDAEQEREIGKMDKEIDKLDNEVDDLESKEETDRELIANLRDTIRILQSR